MGGDISGWSARPLKSHLRRTRPLIQIIIAPPLFTWKYFQKSDKKPQTDITFGISTKKDARHACLNQNLKSRGTSST